MKLKIILRIMTFFQEFSDFVRHVPGFFDQFQQLEQWRSSAWNLLSSSIHRRSGVPPPLLCVTHGNLSSESILVKDNNVIITSWATATLGSPLMDMAMLMLSSFNKQNRSEHSKQLLDTYHFTFCSTLARLGVDQREVFPMFTMDNIIEEYDRLYTFVIIRKESHLLKKVEKWKSFLKHPNLSLV